MIAPRRPRSRRAAVITGALLALLPACASGPPRVPGELVPSSEMIEVPYPPPPARVETIPAPPSPDQVWLDGQWEWAGEVWRWREGIWAKPPPGAYFTPWSTRRRADGQLLFARAEWRDRAGRPLSVGVDGQTCAAPAPGLEAARR